MHIEFFILRFLVIAFIILQNLIAPRYVIIIIIPNIVSRCFGSLSSVLLRVFAHLGEIYTAFIVEI